MERSFLQKLNTFNKTKTPLGESGCLSNLYYLLAAQASSFLIHSPFPNTVSQARFSSLHLNVQLLCVLRNGMHAIGHQVLPSQPLPKEAEDFPRGGKYFHVPLLTELIQFPSKGITWQVSIYVLGAATDYYNNHLSLVFNSLYQ